MTENERLADVLANELKWATKEYERGLITAEQYIIKIQTIMREAHL